MDEQRLPNVAAILCTYNTKEYILDAVKSVCSQDYPVKSLYIADDCSEDETLEVVKNFATKLDVVDDDEEKTVMQGNIGVVPLYYTYIKKNGGPSRARNYAIRAAWDSSHLFAVIDSDDFWKQGKLSKSVMKILAAPDKICAVYTDYLIYNTTNNTITYESKECYSRPRLFQECIVHSGCMINKVALEKCGLYEESLRVCEDLDLWLRFSDYFIFVSIPEPLVVVRVQPKNSTDSVSKQIWEDSYRKVHQRLRDRHTGVN